MTGQGNGTDSGPQLGAPFRRTPGEWAGNQVMHKLIDAGWSIWEVVDAVRADIAFYEANWTDPEVTFSPESYALGYFNACIGIGRANRDTTAESS